MKKTFKKLSIILAITIFISCMPIIANSRTLSDGIINNEIAEISTRDMSSFTSARA